MSLSPTPMTWTLAKRVRRFVSHIVWGWRARKLFWGGLRVTGRGLAVFGRVLGAAVFGVLLGAPVVLLSYEASRVVYLAVGYSALIGLGAGLGTAWGVALFALRSRILALLAGALAAAGALLGWHALDALGASGLDLWEALAERARVGIPVVRFWGEMIELRGSWVYGLWGVELWVASSVAAWIAAQRAAWPCCQDCGAWFQRIRLCGPKEAAPMMAAALTFGDADAIGKLIEDEPLVEHARFELYRCRRCVEANALVVISEVSCTERKRLVVKEIARTFVPAWHGRALLEAIARPAGVTIHAPGLHQEPAIVDRRPTLFDPRAPVEGGTEMRM